MTYEVKLERLDVALRAIVALYKRPRKGGSWNLLAELGLSRAVVEPALQFFTDSEQPLRTDDDIALLLESCPQLLNAAVNLLGKYAQVESVSRSEFYARTKGRKVA